MMWNGYFMISSPKLRPSVAMNFYVAIISINALLASANISDQLKFCSRSDPKLNGCLKSNIQAALVALKDGLYVKRCDAHSTVLYLGDLPNDPIKVSQGTIKAVPPVTFDQQYTNVAIYNASALKVTDVSAQIDDASFSITIEGFIHPSAVFEFNYNFENAILGDFDVSSKGTGIYYEYDKKLIFTLNGRSTKKDGIDYANVTDYKFDYTVGNVTCAFQSDNVEAAQQLAIYINENWPFLFDFEEKGLAQIYGKAYRDYAQRIFDVIPYDQLFPK